MRASQPDPVEALSYEQSAVSSHPLNRFERMVH